MRYMCAERNKLRRVFSTAIDLVKASVCTLKLRVVVYTRNPIVALVLGRARAWPSAQRYLAYSVLRLWIMLIMSLKAIYALVAYVQFAIEFYTRHARPILLHFCHCACMQDTFTLATHSA